MSIATPFKIFRNNSIMIAIFVLSSITIITYGTKYPRMDQRKFVEDSLKNMK